MGASATASAFRQTALGRTIAPTAATAQFESRRGYRHWWRVLPEDFELNTESMPKDVKSLMSSNPNDLGFIDAYWYWRIRAETTITDPENLPKKSYQQLCRDMGLTIVNEAAEHLLGVIELYEYLKSSPFIGPFGTVTNPVLVPAIHRASRGMHWWHRRHGARASVVPMPRRVLVPMRRVRSDLHARACRVRASRQRGCQPHRP